MSELTATATRPRGWRRVLRWVKRGVLGLFAVVIVAVAIVLGLLHTAWGRNQVRLQIESQLRSNFPGGGTVGRVDGSIFGKLIAHDIVINGPDKRPMVTVKRVEVTMSIAPLFKGTARIDTVDASQVVVYVREQPPQDKKPAPKPEPSLWSVELPDIRVHQAHVEITTERGVEVIDDVMLTAGAWLRDGELVASVSAQARWRDQDLAFAAVIQRGQTIEIPLATAGVGTASLTALGVRIGDGPVAEGMIDVRASAALVHAVSELELPGDVRFAAQMRKHGALDMSASIGSATVRILGVADLANQTAKVVVAADVPNVVSLSRGKVTGQGTVVAALEASATHVRGLVSIVGEAEFHTGSFVAAIDASAGSARTSINRAQLIVAGVGVPNLQRENFIRAKHRRRPTPKGWVVGGATADVTRTGETWQLAKSDIAASGIDLAGTKGSLDAKLVASGPVWPEPSITTSGTVDGRAIRYQDISAGRISVGHVHATVEASELPARPHGTAHVEVTNIQQNTLKIPAVSLDARASAFENEPITIDIDSHRIRTLDKKVWTGAGGRITIDKRTIIVNKLHTGTGSSKLTASATMARTSEDLTAELDGRDVALSLLDPELGGKVTGNVKLVLKRGRWSGGGTMNATAITIPNQPSFDATAELGIAGRRVTVTGTATSTAGNAKLALDMTGPRDVTDGVAWRQLQRSAITNLTVAISNVDGRQLGFTGTAEGELTLSATDARGALRVRDVETTAGTIDSDVAITAGDAGQLAAHVDAQLTGLAPVTADATLALPVQLFDPDAWQQHGRGALRAAKIQAKNITFDPAFLARFGVKAAMRGRVDAEVNVTAAAKTSALVLDVTELRGEGLAYPIELHVTGGTSDAGMHLELASRSQHVVVKLDAKTPLTIDGVLAGGARTAPIAATLTIPSVAARDVMLLFGRTDVKSGTVGGKVTIGGTANKPTVSASLVAENLAVVPTIAVRKTPTVEKLELEARWADGHGEVEITGSQSGGRMLKITGRGRPDSLATVAASIEAAKFDLAPLAAFAPGRLRAGRGILDASLTLRGLDPQNGDVRGRLHISDGQMPLPANLGTIREAEIDVTIVKQQIFTKLDARLGGGKVTAQATAQLVGGLPVSAELVSLMLRKISPIGAIQPVIDADITGKFVRDGTKWAGKVLVRKGNVVVPPESGSDLLVAGAPSDLVFVGDRVVVINPKRAPPSKPWLVADIDIGSTKIAVEDRDFLFRGIISGQLQLSLGDGGMGLDGAISSERGDIDVLGRRYNLDRAVIDFDGTLDPRLDIRLIHDFKELTLTVDVSGRSTDPDIRLSGDPGTYTQGQLFAFLGGAEPSGESGSQLGQAVVGGSLALFSSRIGKKLTKYVPFLKIEVFNVEAATASSSRAVRFGRRLGDKSFLLYRHRLEARPDENTGEAVFEYYLKPNLLLDTTAGQRGGGADLMWRKRW